MVYKYEELPRKGAAVGCSQNFLRFLTLISTTAIGRIYQKSQSHVLQLRSEAANKENISFLWTDTHRACSGHPILTQTYTFTAPSLHILQGGLLVIEMEYVYFVLMIKAVLIPFTPSHYSLSLFLPWSYVRPPILCYVLY